MPQWLHDVQAVKIAECKFGQALFNALVSDSGVARGQNSDLVSIGRPRKFARLDHGRTLRVGCNFFGRQPTHGPNGKLVKCLLSIA